MFTSKDTGRDLAIQIRHVAEYHDGVSPLTDELWLLFDGGRPGLLNGSMSEHVLEVVNDYEKTLEVIVPRKTAS